MPRTAAALVVAVIAAACNTSPPPSAEPQPGATGASPSATAGESAPEGADGTIVLANELARGGTGVSVAEALDAASSQPVLVNGVLLRDAEGAIWFCTVLADREPPACGDPTLSVTNFPADESIFDPENARGTGSQTEGGVTWIPNQQLYGVVHPAP